MTALVKVVDPPVQRGPARGWVDILAPAAEVAKTIAPTEFVPRGLRHNVPAVTAAILYGDEVGLGPLASVNEIHVIDGRIFVAAEAQRALVLAAGHEIWPDELTTSRATWCGRRAGSENVTRVSWTLDDARRAKLDGKPNWRAYPRQMLSARASADLVRAVFADVVHGLGAIEEFDGEVGVGAEPAGIPPARPRATRRRQAAAAAVADTTAVVDSAPQAAPLPPLPGENAADAATREGAGADDRGVPSSAATDDRGDVITAPQVRRLQQLMREHGIGDREQRLALAREIVNRPELSTSKDLTPAEADRVIGYLEALDRPPDDEQREP
jgi:hypothetical protein